MGIVLPFAAFAVFAGLFAYRARREGLSTDEYLSRRNRQTFTTITERRGWWIPYVAFASAAWTVLFVMSGFKPILLLFLPLVVLWVPLGTLALRWLYRRTG